MWRGILFFIKLAILVAVAVWLANNPGQVSFDWLGYRIDTSMGMLFLGLAVLALVVVLLYRLGRALAGTPSKISDGMSERRQRRGQEALTRGLIAVQLGDARNARRQVRRAADLLEPQPVLQLLKAQSAQLSGEEAEARAHFNEMLAAEETRLLGLRGLTMLALREGREQEARDYLDRARAIQPDSPWVLNSLFDLSERSGDLPAAEAVLLESQRRGVLPKPEVQRKRAIVVHQRAEAALVAGDRVTAESKARTAAKLQPDLLAPTLLQARLLAERDRKRKAANLLAAAWEREPHPEIADAWLSLDQDAAPLDQVQRVTSLVRGRENHRESRLLQARVALAAELWGEARRHLAPLLEEEPLEQRVCHLMAQVEEGEKGEGAATEWLRRAASALPEPAWLCDKCGAISPSWSAHCGACGSFDSLNWRSPPHLAPSVPVVVEAVESEAVEVEPEPARSAALA